MPNKVPPPGSQPPAPHKPDGDKPAPPPLKGNSQGAQTLNDLLAECTPEQRKKFFDMLCQNIARQIDKDSKKAIEELRKQRQKIEEGE